MIRERLLHHTFVPVYLALQKPVRSDDQRVAIAIPETGLLKNRSDLPYEKNGCKEETEDYDDK